MFPFERRKELSFKIEEQKKQLELERQKLIKYIDDYIKKEVRKLEDDNRSITLTTFDR